MRSISRLVVTFAFILALALSTVPAQAQPLDFGAGFDGSWLEMALNWLDGLLGGGDAASLQTLETGGGSGSTTLGGNYGTMSGSCIDPLGGGCRGDG